MSSSLGQGERREAQRRRRAPGQVTHLVATFASGGKVPEPERAISGPIRVALEATDNHGRLASWFHDDWFTALLQRFGDEFVTLRIAPTPGALLHPTVLYEAEMARRVVPHWRVIGIGYLDDVQSDDEFTAIANGPYHEVQFFDLARDSGAVRSPFATHLSIEKLFVRLRNAQETSTGRSPILVRLPSRNHRTTSANETSVVDTPRTRSAGTPATM